MNEGGLIGSAFNAGGEVWTMSGKWLREIVGRVYVDVTCESWIEWFDRVITRQ